MRRHRRSARVRGHRGQIASNVLDRPASNGMVGVSRRRMNHGAERYRGGSPFSPSVATRQRRRDGMQLAHPFALPIHEQLHRRHIAVDLDGDVLAATLRVEIARVPSLHNVDEMLVGCLERFVGRAVRDLLQPVRAVPVGRRLREAAEVKLTERAGRVRPLVRAATGLTSEPDIRSWPTLSPWPTDPRRR